MHWCSWYTKPGRADDPDRTDRFYLDELFPDDKCECGAQALGHKDYAPGHSYWCDVHESKLVKTGENQ